MFGHHLLRVESFVRQCLLCIDWVDLGRERGGGGGGGGGELVLLSYTHTHMNTVSGVWQGARGTTHLAYHSVRPPLVG